MRLLIKILWSFLLTLSFADVSYAHNKPYIVNFSKEVYGADNKNWSIGEDERGIVYFGNDVGLLEFDGIEWTLHSLPNGLTVRSVSVLSHNTVFTGSYEEFGRWDRDITGCLKYTSLSADLDKSTFRNDDFWKIWSTDKYVYFQSFNSIYVYDYEKIEKLDSLGSVLFLMMVKDEFWVQEMKGAIYRLKGREFEEVKGSHIFKNMDVRIILPYLEDQYLIGTASDGVYIYDGSSFKELNSNLSKLLSAEDLNCGVLTSRGTYFLGTILNGLYEIDHKGNILEHISTINTLQNNTILSLYEDNSRNIWVGQDRGISYIQYLNRMSCFTDPRGNIGSVYGSIIWDNKLFLGTNQGVFYITLSDLKSTSPINKMRLIENTQGQVWSFYTDGNKLYCCHNRGLKLIDKDLSVSEPYRIGTGVYQMGEAKIKNKEVTLLSTYSSLKLIDKDTKSLVNLNFKDEPIIHSEVDHLDNIWLEHFNKGVYRCRFNDDMTRIESYKYMGGDSGDGLPYKLKIFKVGGRIVFLGDSKFYTYDDIEDKIILNEKLNECFGNVTDLKKIIHIQGSQFWALAGSSSLYKFFYDGYNANILESYDIGAQYLSFVNAYENISILNDSLDFVCLDNGFLIYNRNNSVFEKETGLEMPYFNSFVMSVNEKDYQYQDLSESAEIHNKYNSVTIRFSANGVLASNYYFQYWLEGMEEGWSMPQKINSVSYARLPKGKYVFKVRVTDNLGNFSVPIEYEFEVLPPWYKTVWAYIAYLLLITGILIGVWVIILRKYRNAHLLKIRLREEKRLKRINKQLQEVVEEKNAELFSQTSFLIQRNELILKIKSELEDFYKKQNNKSLAPLFYKVNMLLNDNMDTEEDWKRFLINFEQKNTNFFKRLMEVYPQLTSNDLRLCACLRLNLDSKEIAALMNVSVRSVENSRSRLRKKLEIPSHQRLNEFFLQF